MTQQRWATPEWHESIGSTNTEALADARPGRVVVADHQSAGLGRRGRSWSSPPGTGMAISAVLPAVPSALAGWLPLAAGVAVRRALGDSRWPVEAVLKWPNDVLLETGPHPGKLCGVLAQVAPSGAVVVGAGLNVDHDADQLPVPTATSWRLARGGSPLPDGARAAFLEDYLAHLAALHETLAATDPTDAVRSESTEALRAAYRQGCSTLGRDIVVHRPDGTRETGRAVAVDEHGALVVEDVSGGRRVHHAGDVEHVRAQ